VAALAVAMLGTGCGGSASAGSTGPGFRTVPDRVTRLVIDVDSSFDDFRARYERAVPAFSPDKIAGLPDWNAVVARTAEIAPHGFLLYGKVDVTPVMKLNGHTERTVTYLMGNHTVAETMYGKDPGVMLYAPLRTVIYEDRSGKVHFAIDQPSTRFSSFDDSTIAATGRRLDEKLAGLLRDLDLPVPGVLTKG
jgi:uncharacterized protein (DUF302 family)